MNINADVNVDISPLGLVNLGQNLLGDGQQFQNILRQQQGGFGSGFDTADFRPHHGNHGGMNRQIQNLQREISQIQQQIEQLENQGASGNSGSNGGNTMPASCDNDSSTPSSSGCGNNSTPLSVNGNTVNTGRYTIAANTNDDGTLTVTDNQTGKSFKVWGDPHLQTDKGDTANFQHEPVTFKLNDGTKITIDPTNNPGSTEYINRVAITKGNDAVEMTGFQSNLQTNLEPGLGQSVDSQYGDGTVIAPENGQLDQLHVLGGPQINGGNNVDLDQYAGQGNGYDNGSSQQSEEIQLLQQELSLLQMQLMGLQEGNMGGGGFLNVDSNVNVNIA